MRWELKHFVLSGVTAAVTFALAFALGSGIIIATGIPATGGVANIFVAVTVVTIAALIARVPGFAALTVALVFLFAIPTPIGGPPGLYKVVNGVCIGMTFDLVVLLTGRKNWSYVVGGALAAMVSIVSIYFAMLALGLPAVDRLRPLLLPLTAVQGVLGALGAWVGVIIFNKRLKHVTAVKRLLADARDDRAAH